MKVVVYFFYCSRLIAGLFFFDHACLVANYLSFASSSVSSSDSSSSLYQIFTEIFYCIVFSFFILVFRALDTMTTALPWKGSEAKKLLYDDLLSGEVDETMGPREVFMMRPEYSLFPYNNFVSNLRNLRLSIKKRKESALRSENALRNDLSIGIIQRKLPYWPDSEACCRLNEDIASGVVESMTKRELWLSREAYQAFTLLSFSDHVRQCIRLSKERAYWSFINAKKNLLYSVVLIQNFSDLIRPSFSL